MNAPYSPELKIKQILEQRERMRIIGITQPAHCIGLLMAYSMEFVTPTEFAKECQISTAAITQSIDKLEELGYIRRYERAELKKLRATNDLFKILGRRSVPFHITDSGKIAAEKLLQLTESEKEMVRLQIAEHEKAN